MNTASLGAYAAWLAKHETKAPRRRSLDPVEAIDVESPREPTSTDLYSLRISRKESKLPAVETVVVTPDTVAEIVERGRAAAALAQAKMTGGLGTRHTNAGQVGKASIGKADSMQAVDKKTKKRVAEDTCDSIERAGKKPKTATSSSSTNSTKKPSHSAAIVRKERETRDHGTKHSLGSAAPSRCSATSTSSYPQLPMINEVRYWRDVDRFSFLA